MREKINENFSLCWSWFLFIPHVGFDKEPRVLCSPFYVYSFYLSIFARVFVYDFVILYFFLIICEHDWHLSSINREYTPVKETPKWHTQTKDAYDEKSRTAVGSEISGSARSIRYFLSLIRCIYLKSRAWTTINWIHDTYTLHNHD